MLGQSSASNALRCHSELWAVTRQSNLTRTARNVRISTNCRTYDVRVEHGFDSNAKLIPITLLELLNISIFITLYWDFV